ncbi:MAG: AMP-binding protein, partial [Verrucomicrobia bacterium]|nr:AMP-binding protein [Verrucomicrobiota bacterium]
MIGRGAPFDPQATLLQDRNLSTAWLRSAQENSSKTAVFWGDDELSYARLLGQSCWVATHLKNQLGIKRGDRVALWLKNCPQFIS